VTLMPDAAQLQAAAIFLGETETTWPRFLSECGSAAHSRRYCVNGVPQLARAPQARQGLFHRRDHPAGVMFATRGCAHRCDFCTLAVI